jgi:hypothetical protein
MAGGGGSGAGWRMVSTIFSGHSGGYVFSQPVNLVAGETMSVVVGGGGIGYTPVYSGSIAAAPAGDDGLGGYPGRSSKLVSPSAAGTLLECSGGSGVSFGYLDNYTGGKVAGNFDGARTGSGTNAYLTPNRVATGAFATANGPGACGPAQYGIGNVGIESWSFSSGNYIGGQTPFGYGSGGGIFVTGCYVTATTTGLCIGSAAGRDGVVFIDVLY